MSMNAITGDVASFTPKPLNTAVVLDAPIKGTPSANEQSAPKTTQSSVVDAGTNNKVASGNKQTVDTSIERQEKPARTMNHVVEVYNLQGKVRIKFIDSHNNVIYQIPSEMVAKMEDQMMKSDTSPNITG